VTGVPADQIGVVGVDNHDLATTQVGAGHDGFKRLPKELSTASKRATGVPRSVTTTSSPERARWIHVDSSARKVLIATSDDGSRQTSGMPHSAR
jgi:hypothetical protein